MSFLLRRPPDRCYVSFREGIYIEAFRKDVNVAISKGKEVIPWNRKEIRSTEVFEKRCFSLGIFRKSPMSCGHSIHLIAQEVKVSNEKKGPNGCFGNVGDEILPSYVGINYVINHYKDPVIKQPGLHTLRIHVWYIYLHLVIFGWYLW